MVGGGDKQPTVSRFCKTTHCAEADAAADMTRSCSSLCYLLLTGVACVHAAPQPKVNTMQVRGPFEVKLAPLAADNADWGGFDRFSLDKQFHGALEASSKGQMFAASTAVKGSAGYVAIERVTGALNGRAGSFVLQHRGVMNRGAPELLVTVVPDSGTGELIGLSGRMEIVIEPGGAHFYVFEYTLDAAR